MINSASNNTGTKNAPWYSWKKRTRFQKNAIITSLVLLIFVSFISLIFFLLYVKIEVCSTPACVRTSKELSKYIDSRASPCEDFYRFSCGNFLQNTNLDNRGSRSVQDIMEDEIQFEIRNMLERPTQDPGPLDLAKKFYRACMNEEAIEAEGLEKIKEIFKHMGGWPTLEGSDWRGEKFEWKEAVYHLRRVGVNCDVFFRVSVERDGKNGSRYILGIHNVMSGPQAISNEVIDYMVDIARMFGAKSSNIRKESEEVFNLHLKLAKVPKESAADNQTRSKNQIFSLYQLHKTYYTIPWFMYFTKLVAPMTYIRPDDAVLVGDPLYLERLGKILQQTSNRTLANFIAWHIIRHLINYLPAKFLNRTYRYLEKMNGKMIKPPRWKICVKATEERMETVISTAYVQNNFNDSTQQRVLKLISDIKMQFKHTLKRRQWLDKKTKDIILKMLSNSTEEIASYEDVKDALDETRFYDKVKVHEKKLLESVLNLDFINTNIKFNKLRKTYKENWLKNNTFVTGVHSYYSPTENILRLPIGIFRGIYYQTDRPEYMNYAGLGSIIAHEISHVFIEAEYRDLPSELPGELRSWWSPESLLNYNEKLQCLANQYRKFEVGESGQHLNPLKTRDEDVADLAGMKVSYDTYIKWVQENGAEPRLPGLNYAPNQLFWISAAIHHCSKYSTPTLERYIANYQWSPEQYRVNGPLQNIEEFARDFGCPVGSKMNPTVKCEVW